MRKKVISIFFILLFFSATVSPCLYAYSIHEQEQSMESSDIVLENYDCFVFGIFVLNITGDQRPPIYRGGFHPIRHSVINIFGEKLNETYRNLLHIINNYEHGKFISLIFSIISLIHATLFIMHPLVGNLFPISIEEKVYFSRIINNTYPGGYDVDEYPCNGFIWTSGINGIVKYSGNVVGKLGNYSALGDYHESFLGVTNFTGFHTPRYMIGTCSHIKIGSDF